MFAANADWFARGDAQGIPTTTNVQKIPGWYRFTKPTPANLLLGALVLLLILHLVHRNARGRRR